MAEWISVKERQPEVHQKVLVCYESGRVEIDFRLSWGGYVLESQQGKVTHWMPLPEPPKEEVHHE